MQQVLAMWVLSTRSFQLAEGKYPLTAFSSLVIFYRGVNNDIFIRPICFPVEQGIPMMPEDIVVISNHAMDIDRQNHPERFTKKAEVITIKK